MQETTNKNARKIQNLSFNSIMDSRTGFVRCLSTSLVKTKLPLLLVVSLKFLATKFVVVALEHLLQMPELREIVKKFKPRTFGFRPSISTSTNLRAIQTWFHTRTTSRTAPLLFDQILAVIGGAQRTVFYITRIIIKLFRLPSMLRLSWRTQMVLRIRVQERLIIDK